MQGSRLFAKICEEARRERSEHVWSLISKLLAAPRTTAEKAKQIGTKPIEGFQPTHLAHG